MDTTAVLERLREVMRRSAQKTLDWEHLDADTPIDALGFDSLAILDLLYDIQQAFGVSFEPEDLMKVQTVRDLAEFLGRRTA
ncbi:MAG: acyl carrier protein [Lentisphaerae bacterium]|nr:acyl carrier protein [Lentisphaerota bacterium]